jgi:hypothetical protein
VSPRPLSAIVVAAFVVGAALMVLSDSTLTRVLGLACLFAFIAGGVFLIADPRFLADDD